MKRIKAVIFDLDGTLANTLPLCIEAFRRSVEPLTGRFLPDEEIIAHLGPSEEGTIMALVPEHYDEGIASYLHFYEKLHSSCRSPFSGIPEILAKLRSKNIKLAMVTGKGKISTAISLKQFGLNDIFEFIETGSPTGTRKADGIRQILDQWCDIKKREVIYVGDATGDIIACQELGISIVAAAWADTAETEKLKQLHPDILFNNIDDFADWLYANIQPVIQNA